METQTVDPEGLPFLRFRFKDFELIRPEGPRFGDMFKFKYRFFFRNDFDQDDFKAMKILTIPEYNINGVPYSILNHVSTLRKLDYDNIVNVDRVLKDDKDVEHLYLISEYIKDSLAKRLASPGPYDVERQGKHVLREALSGLLFLHMERVIHRNLKPHHILLAHGDSAVKLTDFGVAESMEPPLSPYSINMGNPCYKAPELLLGFTNYSTAVDIWSMGCIFAEMIKRQPLFIGKDGPEILTEIFWLLGTPTEETWPGVSSICTFIKAFDPPIEPKDLAAEFPMLEPNGLDLLSKMLCLCPNSRISAEEALDHPYLRR